MVIIYALRNLLQSVKYFFASIYRISLLQTKYPSCKFYTGVFISNTTFKRYNIVFNDTIIDSCTIDAHTYIQKRSNIFNCDIGKFCSIASGVTIGPGIHKVDGVSTHPAFFIYNTPLICKFAQQDNFETSKRITIGNDVWIGEKAVILDGITIGTGAIIAAGAVVTKDVSAYSIVGGVPAKHIKYRFDEQIILALLKSEWWELPEENLRQNYKLFSNAELFLKQTK